MADVFEKEGSPTQDATYREHLDRNWEAGNRKFAELEGKVQSTEQKYDDDIKKVQEHLDRLNQAVFGYGEYEVNYETPHHDSSVTEINVDSNPLLKGE